MPTDGQPQCAFRHLMGHILGKRDVDLAHLEVAERAELDAKAAMAEERQRGASLRAELGFVRAELAAATTRSERIR